MNFTYCVIYNKLTNNYKGGRFRYNFVVSILNIKHGNEGEHYLNKTNFKYVLYFVYNYDKEIVILLKYKCVL